MSINRSLALRRFEDYLQKFGTPRILDRDGLVFVELISDRYLITGDEMIQINEKFYDLTDNKASLFCLRVFRTFEDSFTIKKRLCQDPPREGTLDYARTRAPAIDIKIREIDDRYLMCGADLFSEPAEPLRVYFVPNNKKRDMPTDGDKYPRMIGNSDEDETAKLQIVSPLFNSSKDGFFFVDVIPRD
jgi:hypothetical protein